jgi:hypothetical protein
MKQSKTFAALVIAAMGFDPFTNFAKQSYLSRGYPIPKKNWKAKRNQARAKRSGRKKR